MFNKVHLLAFIAAAAGLVQASPLAQHPSVITSFAPPSPTQTCGTTNTITVTAGYQSGIVSGSGIASSAFPFPSGSGIGSSGFVSGSGVASSAISFSVRPTAFPSSGFASGSGSVRPTAFPSGSGIGSVGFPSGSGVPSSAISFSGRPTAFPSSGFASSVTVRPTGFPSGVVSGSFPFPSGVISSFFPEPSGSAFPSVSGSASGVFPPAITNTYPSGTWAPDCSVVVTVTQYLPGGGSFTARPTAFPSNSAF